MVLSSDKWEKNDYALSSLGLMKILARKTISVECKRQKADFRQPNLEVGGRGIIKCVLPKNERGDMTVIEREWAKSQKRW